MKKIMKYFPKPDWLEKQKNFQLNLITCIITTDQPVNVKQYSPVGNVAKKLIDKRQLEAIHS